MEFVMPRSSLVRCAFLLALLVSSTRNTYVAQSSVSSLPLSLEDIIKESKSGLPEELIITKIKKNNRPFNLSADEMRELQNSGIRATVIKYLLDPSQPYTAPPPPPAPAGQPAALAAEARNKNYPKDEHAGSVPLDPGLYRFVENTPQKTEVRLLLGESQGAGITKVLMKKGRAVGYLLGPTAN